MPADDIVPTRLYCTNRDVDQENNARLMRLNGEPVAFSSLDSFHARPGAPVGATGDERNKLVELLNKKVPADLRLKVQAQVILLRKLHGSGLVNGSRGVVVELQQQPPTATVRFDSGQVLKVERDTFQQAGSATVLSRRQLPLRLGWALTVHKSQGITLSRAEVQLDDAFSCGQPYVALSRLTSFLGLWIVGRGLGPRSVRAHPSALAFYGVASAP